MHMHYFRGFAILNIMLVHIWAEPGGIVSTPHTQTMDLIRYTLFQASTLYFIFISGFLFYYLSKNFSVRRYYKSKLTNVILPYLIIASAMFALYTWRQAGPLSLYAYLETILLGTAQVQYWYIPFISLVFLVSPLLLRIPKPLFKRLTLVLLLVPIFGTRTGTQLSLGQYLYFVPVYLFGMYFSINHDACMDWITRHIKAIAAVALVATGLFAFTYLVHYRFQPDLSSGPGGICDSLFYLQKMALILLAVHLLEKIQHRNIRLLDILATYSFALYFLHTLFDLESVKARLFLALSDSFWLVPAIVAYSMLVMAATLACCMLLKRLLGRRSRMLIGA